MMKKLLKEPLVHFLILGFLIFGYYQWVSGDRDSEEIIVIDQSEYDYLLNSWKKQWYRDPNPQEIKSFIDQYLRQEVFYKEALSMNLDHNDIIIKRRLAQKMEAVSDDVSALIKPPSERELRTFYESNEELFRLPASFAFKQVLFLNNEPDLNEEMETVRSGLNDGVAIPSLRRDKLSIPTEWELTYRDEIENAFGGDFAASLDQLPLNEWVGPVSSGYGKHLVCITKKRETHLARFEDIKPYVQKEFEYRSEMETQEQVYEDLLKKYEVRITAEGIPEEIAQSYRLQ